MQKNDLALWALSCAALVFACASVFVRLPRVCILLSFLLCAVCFAVLAAFYAKRAQQQAEQARQLQEELSQMRSAFAQELSAAKHANLQEVEALRSTLSHDLRMPISIIQGYAELLENGIVDDPALQQEYLNKIAQRTRYISDLLSEQLVTARSGDLPVATCVPLDLVELVRQVSEDLAGPARGQGILMNPLLPDTPVMVQADQRQLHKVFFNLIENSIKYMGREGIITIRVSPGDDVGTVIVKDDGLGLDEKEARRVFEYEYQGSNRTSGHGHGLFLVKQAIEAQHGTISAHSQPGQGMTIRFSLPLAPATIEAN